MINTVPLTLKYAYGFVKLKTSLFGSGQSDETTCNIIRQSAGAAKMNIWLGIYIFVMIE